MKSSVIEIRHDSVFLCQAAGMRSQKHKFHHSVWNMDSWRRCVGQTEARRPRSTKSPAAARPKLRGDDIREAPAFPKEGRRRLPNRCPIRFDSAQRNLRRWRACRSGAGAVSKRVPPGLRLGDDACIFQRYVPDSRLVRDFNSGTSEEKEEREAAEEEEETGAGEHKGSNRRRYRRLCLCSKYNILCRIL